MADHDPVERQCAMMVEVLKKISSNGRCNYHEDIAKGLAYIKGGLAVVLLLLAFTFVLTWKTKDLIAANENQTVRIESELKQHEASVVGKDDQINDLEHRVMQLERMSIHP